MIKIRTFKIEIIRYNNNYLTQLNIKISKYFQIETQKTDKQMIILNK